MAMKKFEDWAAVNNLHEAELADLLKGKQSKLGGKTTVSKTQEFIDHFVTMPLQQKKDVLKNMIQAMLTDPAMQENDITALISLMKTKPGQIIAKHRKSPPTPPTPVA